MNRLHSLRRATLVPSLVLLKTHLLPSLAKRTLRVVLLLGMFIALASQATAAPVVFDARGIFEGGTGIGGDLSGTVTIDTATGQVLSADLVVVGSDGKTELAVFDVVLSSGTDVYGNVTIHVGGYLADKKLSTYGTVSGIVLAIPSASLVGYVGGNLSENFYFLLDYSYWWAGSGLNWGIMGDLYDGSLEPMPPPKKKK